MTDTKQLAWRVIANGVSLDVVQGEGRDPLRGGMRLITSTVIAREGQVIKEDLHPNYVKRYEEGEEVARSQVERVEVQVDDDGNEVYVPYGGSTASEPAEVDPDVLARAETAEAEVTDLRTRVTELEGQVAEAQEAGGTAQGQVEALQGEVQRLEGELKEAQEAAEAASEGALSFGDLSKEALVAEAEAKKITVTRAEGEGDPVKADYVRTLEEARSSS